MRMGVGGLGLCRREAVAERASGRCREFGAFLEGRTGWSGIYLCWFVKT